MSWMSSTPARYARSTTCSMIWPRMSGVRIGGSGTEMSSKAIVSRMPGAQERVERVEAERAVEGRGDRPGHVGERGDRRRRVDDPRADREALEPELLAGVEERGRRVLADLRDARVALERGAPRGALDGRRRADGAFDEGHQAAFRRSKTVFTRPLRAARGACSSAALKSRRWNALSTRRPGRRRPASFSAVPNSSP